MNIDQSISDRRILSNVAVGITQADKYAKPGRSDKVRDMLEVMSQGEYMIMDRKRKLFVSLPQRNVDSCITTFEP